MRKAEPAARIRPVRAADNEELGRIIREVMTEFGAVGEGYSIADPEVDAIFEAYPEPVAAYVVAEVGGRLVGGSGIGPLEGAGAGVCELRKMYLLPEARGLGLGRRLLEICLDAARERGYRMCYLETLAQMDRARKLYEDFGFRPLEAPLGDTGHFGCNRWYALPL